MTNKKFIEKLFLYGLPLLAAFLFFRLLQPVVTLIILAIIVVYLAAPLYHWFEIYVPRWVSMVLIWLVIVLCLIIPLALLGDVVVNQLGAISNDVVLFFQTSDFQFQTVLDKINIFLEELPFVSLQVEREMVQQGITSLTKRGAKEFAGIASSFGTSLVANITNMILFIFTVSGLLIGHKQLKAYLKKLLPLKADIFERYSQSLGRIGASMIKATIVIALAQSLITVLSLWIVGVPYLGLWGVLAFLLGMIPLIGSAFVAVPVGIALLLFGNITGGIIVILVNQLISNNVDSILRPKLADTTFAINETLILLSVFGGMAYFGILGVIYGPVIMSFVLMTFDIYIREH